jgi:long-chain acyl-CoA synthetase
VERHTVAGLIRAHAAERPDAEMLVCGAERRTWSQQYRRSCRVANALTAAGLGPGDRVAFLDRNGLAYFDLLFGGALMGAVNVAVNWRLAAPEVEAVVEDAEAPLLVIHPEYLPLLDAMPGGLPHVRRTVVLDERYDEWLDGQPEDDPGHRGAPEEVCAQLYTSGTTGLPKGVMLSNANLATTVGRADESFGVDESTVSLVAMPLFHIGGSGWALAGMSRGGRSVVVRDVLPAELLGLIEAERVTETFIVPAVLMFMLQTPEIDTTDLSSLRNVFYGASPISEDVLTQCMKKLGCDLTQVYGLTETTGAITALRPEEHRGPLLRSAGRPHPGVELRVVSPDDGRPLGPGEVGEVVTRSPFNMVGYWKRPADTAATIDPDGWLHTGDAGYLDADGYLYLHDRIKDMIVTGGENVYPAEVENALLAHPAVADAAVIGVPDGTWGEAVKALVVRAVDSGDSVTEAVLVAHCHELLAGYKCPKTVDFVELLPRNPSGKLLKRELREPYWRGRARRVG